VYTSSTQTLLLLNALDALPLVDIGDVYQVCAGTSTCLGLTGKQPTSSSATQWPQSLSLNSELASSMSHRSLTPTGLLRTTRYVRAVAYHQTSTGSNRLRTVCTPTTLCAAIKVSYV
jgi:hypothetical protein